MRERGKVGALQFIVELDFAGDRDFGGNVDFWSRERCDLGRFDDPFDRHGLTGRDVQAAHCILSRRGPDTDLKRWGMQLCSRGGKNAKKRALVAVARKLAILLHRLWVTAEVYVPLRQASQGGSMAPRPRESDLERIAEFG